MTDTFAAKLGMERCLDCDHRWIDYEKHRTTCYLCGGTKISECVSLRDIRDAIAPTYRGDVVYECVSCDAHHPIERFAYTCPACGGLLSLRDLAERLGHPAEHPQPRVELADVEATLQFAVISVIILPLLPNETFGPPPIDVINPYKIWLMVVLIVGLSLVGYVLYKLFGNKAGTVFGGLLGGLISSTVTMVPSSSMNARASARACAAATAALPIP